MPVMPCSSSFASTALRSLTRSLRTIGPLPRRSAFSSARSTARKAISAVMSNALNHGSCKACGTAFKTRLRMGRGNFWMMEITSSRCLIALKSVSEANLTSSSSDDGAWCRHCYFLGPGRRPWREEGSNRYAGVPLGRGSAGRPVACYFTCSAGPAVKVTTRCHFLWACRNHFLSARVTHV